MNKRKAKAYVDDDSIDIEGSKSTDNASELRKKALKKLKNTVYDQLVKTASERAVAAEIEGDEEKTEELIKKANRLKKDK